MTAGGDTNKVSSFQKKAEEVAEAISLKFIEVGLVQDRLQAEIAQALEETFNECRRAEDLRAIAQAKIEIELREQVRNEAFNFGLEEAAKITHEAMSVWCALYAPQECGKESVTKALALRDEHGGTLGYIAYVESSIRALRKVSDEGV